MHQDYLTYSTTGSSVSGERNHQTITRRLSARPQVTHVRGRHVVVFENEPKTKVGYDAVFYLEGYNFSPDTITVYVSASPGTYTNHLSAVSEFNLHSDQSSISSIYPAFSGFELFENYPSLTPPDSIEHCYYIVNSNTLQVNISATSASGKLEIIVANKAGYSTLYSDTSSTYSDGTITSWTDQPE